MGRIKPPACPHCGRCMEKWRIPVDSSWPYEYFYVCFNDDCPYYVEGWHHLWKEQHTHASYRCRLDPDSGKSAPLPVWSADALKSGIMV